MHIPDHASRPLTSPPHTRTFSFSNICTSAGSQSTERLNVASSSCSALTSTTHAILSSLCAVLNASSYAPTKKSGNTSSFWFAPRWRRLDGPGSPAPLEKPVDDACDKHRAPVSSSTERIHRSASVRASSGGARNAAKSPPKLSDESGTFGIGIRRVWNIQRKMAPRMWNGYARSDMVAMRGGGRKQRSAYLDRLVGAWLWRRGHVEFRDRISTHDFVNSKVTTFSRLYVHSPGVE